MKSFKKVYVGLLIALIGLTTIMTYMTRTYSYGLYTEITGSSGSYVLNYYDSSSDHKVTCSIANEYYGERRYTFRNHNNKTIYFHDCKQITESAYETGVPREEADIRAANKGKSAYRVSTLAQAKSAVNDIFLNNRTGEYYLEFAVNENIDWTAFEKWFKQKYGVVNYKQNYYTYAVKGEWEPARYGLTDIEGKNSGTIKIETDMIRMMGNEKKIAESYVNSLLPYLQGDGSDYQKILASYQYLLQHTKYFVDDGYNNMIDSNTSIFDTFIEGESVCIGYSIAFSYLMDKLGIESYIVDRITKNDPNTQTFASTHTYNLVKLDGKFYIIDLTGGPQFLTAASGVSLYDNGLSNLSSTAYNKSGKPTTYSFNSNTIKQLKAKALAIKTTTTTKQKLTTTQTKTTSYEGSTTTKRQSTNQVGTTTEPTYSRSTTKDPWATTSNTQTISKQTIADPDDPLPTTTRSTTTRPPFTTTMVNGQVVTYTTYPKYSTTKIGNETITYKTTQVNGEIVTITTITNKKIKKTTIPQFITVPLESGEIIKIDNPDYIEAQEVKKKNTMYGILFFIGFVIIAMMIVYKALQGNTKRNSYQSEVEDILRRHYNNQNNNRR